MKDDKKLMPARFFLLFLSLVIILIWLFPQCNLFLAKNRDGNSNQSIDVPHDPNENIPLDIPEIPPPLPREKSVPVGRIPANFEVTPDGAAVYHIPIDVLPGRGGIQPNLGLIYNSKGGVGILGIRWMLSGLSMITRAGHSYSQDGHVNPVRYTEDDHFHLDGQRLVAIEGTYGHNNTEYRTRKDIFARIISFVDQGEEGNGPEYFKVYTKDGLILTYGKDGPSGETAFLYGRNSVRRAWALSKAEDRMGNYMLIYYMREMNGFLEDKDGDGLATEILGPAEREQTEMVPSIMLYTGNEVMGDRPQRWVKFTYDNHPTPRYGYSGGIRISTTKLLSRIRVGTGNMVGGDNDINMVKKYELEYYKPLPTYFSPQPYLISVTEKDRDNVAKPPTRFEWTKGVGGFGRILYSDHPAPLTRGSLGDTDEWRASNKVIPMDVNNDGFTDLVYPSARGGGASSWRILLNGGQDYFEAEMDYFSDEVDTGVASDEPGADGWGSGIPYPLARVMDYNQDGFMDLLLNDGHSTWHVLLNNAARSEPFFEDRPFDTGIPVITPSPDSFFPYRTETDYIRFKAFYTYLLDVNADGTKDLVYAEIVGNEDDAEHMHRLWRYRLHDGEQFGAERTITGSDRDRVQNPVKPLLIDMDGDGIVELLTYYGSPRNTYTRFDFAETTLSSYHHTNLPLFHTQMFQDFSGDFHGENIGAVFIMDINGDGLKDVLYVRKTLSDEAIGDGRWYPNFSEAPKMWINNGIDFIGGNSGLEAFFAGIPYHSYNFFQAAILDYNLDGRDDLLIANKGVDTAENRGDAWQAVRWDIILASDISHVDGSEVGFQRIRTIEPMNPIIRGYNNNYIPAIMDVNGDFLPDLVGIAENNFFMTVQMKIPRFVITKIRDGMIGIPEDHRDWENTWTVSIDYTSTTDPDVYREDYAEELPPGVTTPDLTEGTVKNRPAMLVASSFSLDNEIGKTPFTYDIKYFDSRYDRYWGWLGFGHVQRQERLTETITHRIFDNYSKEERLMVRHLPFGYFPYQGLPVYEWTQAVTDEGQRYRSLRSNTYKRLRLDRKRYFSYLESFVSSYDYFPDEHAAIRLMKTVYETISMNDYGEVVRASLENGEGDEENRLLFYINYDDDASQWLIGRPKTALFNWTTGGFVKSRKWEYGYHADTKLVNHITRSPRIDRYRQEIIYGYDDYGNITESEIFARDARGALQTKHHTYVTYDSFEHIFPRLIRKPYGLIAQYEYSPEGLVQVVGSYNGEASRFGYDGFNRLRRAEYPFGLIEEVGYEIRTYADEMGEDHRGHSRMRMVVNDNRGQTLKWDYDRLGRLFHTNSQGFDGTMINSSIQYNDYGLIETIQFPRLVGSGLNPFLTYHYDNLKRVEEIEDSKGNVTSFEYNGLEIEKTDPRSHTTMYTYNSIGQLCEVTDHIEGKIHFEYGPFGLVQKIVDSLGKQIYFRYDPYGRIEYANEPAARSALNYEYDGFDQLVWMKNASEGESTYSYDSMGRIEETIDGDVTTQYLYDDADSNTLGRLHKVEVSGNWANEKTYYYTDQGLLGGVNTHVNGEDFNHRFEYNDTGALLTHHYPMGPEYSSRMGALWIKRQKQFALRYHYNSFGYLSAISDLSEANFYWTILAMDASNHVTEETYGNGIVTNRSYEPLTGYIESITSDVQDFSFTYDANGNLEMREDNSQDISETFTYDDLDRLHTATSLVEGESSMAEYNYDPIGNIVLKSDVGSYVYAYASRQPYTLQQVEGAEGLDEYTNDRIGNIERTPQATIDYTYFNKPKNIRIRGEGEDIAFEYDGDLNRLVKRQSAEETLYLDGLVRKTNSGGRQTYYYHLPNAVFEMKATKTGLDENVLYKHFDHLGSLQTLTNQAGEVVDTFFFDPFGQRRDSFWAGPEIPLAPSGVAYGFTGHEHDEDFGLNFINMRGRMYDPHLGRFLNPDPVLQSPILTQNYGPYNYVLNNPLTFIDPTGNEVGGGSDIFGPDVISPQWMTMTIPSSQTMEAFHPAPAPNWDAKVESFSAYSPYGGGPDLMSALGSNHTSPVAPPNEMEDLMTPTPFTETGFHGSRSLVTRISPEEQEEGLTQFSILMLTEGLFPVANAGVSIVGGAIRRSLSRSWEAFLLNTPLRRFSARYWEELAGTHEIVVGYQSPLQLETAAALGNPMAQGLLTADLSQASSLTIVGHAKGALRAGENSFPAFPGMLELSGNYLSGRQLGMLLRARGFRGEQINLYVCSAASTGLQHELAMTLRGVSVRAPYGLVKYRSALGAPHRVGVQYGPSRGGPIVIDDIMWSVLKF